MGSETAPPAPGADVSHIAERHAELVLRAKEDGERIAALEQQLRWAVERVKVVALPALPTRPHIRADGRDGAVARRPGSAVGCRADAADVLPRAAAESNAALLRSVDDALTAAARAEAAQTAELAVLRRQLEVQVAMCRTLTDENAELKARLASDVLRRNQTARLERAHERQVASRRVRVAGMCRLEAAERAQMALHDEAFYAARDVALRTAPRRDVTLAFIDFVPERSARAVSQDAFDMALQLLHAAIDSATVALGGYIVGRRDTRAVVAHHRATDAVDFVRVLLRDLRAQPWPAQLLALADFAPVGGAWRGPRIRCALAAGTPEASIDPVSGRMRYAGDVVAQGIALIHRLHPGEVGASQELVAAVQRHAPLRAVHRTATHASLLLLPDDDAQHYQPLAMSPAAREEMQERADDARGGGAGPWLALATGRHLDTVLTSVHVAQQPGRGAATTVALVMGLRLRERTCRLLEQQMMAAEDHCANPRFASPPPGPAVAVVVCDVADADTLAPDLRPCTLRTVTSALQELAAVHGGYVAQREGAAALAAFPAPRAALAFATEIHVRLLALEWDPRILDLPGMSCTFEDNDSRKRLIFRGPRLRVGVESGSGVRVARDPVTGHVAYEGPVAHRAANLCALARPGETLATGGVMQQFRAETSLSPSSSSSSPARPGAEVTGEAAAGLTTSNKGGRQLGWTTVEVHSAIPARIAPRAKLWLRSAVPRTADDVRLRRLRAMVHLRPQPAPAALTPQHVRALRRAAQVQQRNGELARRLECMEAAAMRRCDARSGMLGSVPPLGSAAACASGSHVEICVLFADLQGSRHLRTAFADVFTRCEAFCNGLVLSVVAGFEGYLVKHDGANAFMIAFPSAQSAVEAALNIQSRLLAADWPPELLRDDCALRVRDKGGSLLYSGLRLRCGIAVGPAAATHQEGDARIGFSGPCVALAHKLSRAASGGDVLVSHAAVDSLALDAPSLLARVAVTPVGDARLAACSIAPRALSARATRAAPGRQAKAEQQRAAPGRAQGLPWWQQCAPLAAVSDVRVAESPRGAKRATLAVAAGGSERGDAAAPVAPLDPSAADADARLRAIASALKGPGGRAPTSTAELAAAATAIRRILEAASQTSGTHTRSGTAKQQQPGEPTRPQPRPPTLAAGARPRPPARR